MSEGKKGGEEKGEGNGEKLAKGEGEVCALFYRAQSDTRALNWQKPSPKRCIKLAGRGRA